MAEEAALAVVGKFVGNFVTLIGRQLGYVFCYKGNIKKMKNQDDQLEAKRNAVHLSVEATINNCEVVGPDVELWLKRVEEEKKEADLVLSDVENIGNGCLNEWCLHLKSRYWLSRKATKRTRDLVDLLAQGDFSTIAYPPPALGKVPTSTDNNEKIQLAGVEGQGDGESKTMPDASLVTGSGIASTSTGSSGELKSRLVILENVMEAVRDVKIRTIGICGMGGVGKTTLVKEVAKRAKEELLFDEIAIVVVSQNPDVKSIQLGIADFLGLELKQESSLARATRLHERLNQTDSKGKPKRVLVILDDLWKKLDLEEVGIRYPDDQGGCKVIFTSRNVGLCPRMKAVAFLIPVLPEEEAWSLFQSSLPTSASYPIAKAIVTECKGLPIAITTIAMLLTDEEENTWNDVLRQLKMAALQGEYEEIYTVFKVSYDNLKSEEIKEVFLLCCLFPEDSDIPIEDVARYGMGLKVFENRGNRHEARISACVYIEALKKLNLLLDGKEPEFVKMHDLVRDFGISIASEGKFLVRFDRGLKEWPVDDTCERYTHISMQCDEIDELLNGRLKYSNLKLLKLTCTRVFKQMGTYFRSFEFPERLDEVVGELQVLALQNMSIPSLLRSLEGLKNLRTLSLCGCILQQSVSSIGNVAKLEILSVANSDILELPREIGKLSWLRLLDLTGCKYLRKIAPGVLKSLTRLEELYMTGSPIRWSEKVNAWADDKESYASFTELKLLSNLAAIEITIPRECLHVDVNWANLKKFRITDGCALTNFYGVEKVFQNTLVIHSKELFRVKGILKALCKKTKLLHVGVAGLKNLDDVVESEDLTSLNTLTFYLCEDLVSVFGRKEHGFNLRHSSVISSPFGNLRRLVLKYCDKLESICSMSTASGFTNLEELEILGCSLIEEIFSVELARFDHHRDGRNAVEFPKLKTVYLKDLPNLVSFCKSMDIEVKLPQLKTVKFKELPKLISLYPEMNTLADSDCRDGSSTKHPFFHQKIIENSGDARSNEVQTTIHVTLNNEVELEISDMEAMKELWHGEVEAASSTCGPKKVNISKCKSLSRVFSSNTIVQQFQCIESLELRVCYSLEVVYDVRTITNIIDRGPCITGQGFRNLKQLIVYNCSIRSVFSLSIARSMSMLEKVEVGFCYNMEAIFSEETGGEDQETSKEADDSKIVFPKLKTLRLDDLLRLVGFCRYVDVVELPQLETLYLGHLRNLTGLNTGIKASVSDKPLFDDKVTLTNLRELDISCMENLTTVFSENVSPQLLSLQSIKLYTLRKLTCVWKNGPHVTLGFENLEALSIWHCDSLRHLFTPSLAKNFLRFKKLYVSDCMNLEDIVADEEEARQEEFTTEDLPILLFPNLEILDLEKVPKLSSVLPKPYSFNWSSLKCIRVEEEKRHLLRQPKEDTD